MRVHDEADVGLIDAHTKGNGSHHQRRFVMAELLLVAPTFLIRQSGVIGERGPATPVKLLAELIYLLACAAIDDARLTSACFEESDNLLQGFPAGFDRQ